MVIARCTIAETDLGQTLVAEGLAWAFLRFSPVYADVESQARSAQIGICLRSICFSPRIVSASSVQRDLDVLLLKARQLDRQLKARCRSPLRPSAARHHRRRRGLRTHGRRCMAFKGLLGQNWT